MNNRTGIVTSLEDDKSPVMFVIKIIDVGYMSRMEEQTKSRRLVFMFKKTI